MSLQERVRYFEYMRPRYSNPSFASSNVGASLGLTFVPEQPQPKTILKNYSEVPEPQPPQPKEQQQSQLSRQENTGRRSKSNLSNYGTSSLGTLPKMITERDIYEKQQKKYNIITILPKEYNETIKKYPKYRLENMDQNYYRKLKLQEQYNPKHYTSVDTNANYSNPQQSRILRQAESAEVRQSMEGPTGEKLEKGFRPKMLNNIDQLTGVL